MIPEFEPSTQEPIGHWLAVGTLDSETPTWFEPLVEAPWQFSIYAEQKPVVDGPVEGQVLFTADDGVVTKIWTVGVGGEEPRFVAATPLVVFLARMAPRSVGYLVAVDRTSGQDQGLFRVALDGDGSLDRVMPPPLVDQANTGSGIRLAATTRFERDVRVSPDGGQVARMACGDPFGTCVLDVLTVADGTVRGYAPPELSGDLEAVGDGMMLGTWYCNDPLRCVTEGLDLRSGEPRLLPGRLAVADERGHLVMLQVPSPTISAQALFYTSLDGTDVRLAIASDWDVRPVYQQGIDDEGIRLELPWGWVAVSFDRLLPDDRYEVFRAAVRLSDGGWVPIVSPWIAPIGGGHD
ncbi:MAG: hypothetical protein ACRD0W_19570 [Acidimicrobiales bacterium]